MEFFSEPFVQVTLFILIAGLLVSLIVLVVRIILLLTIVKMVADKLQETVSEIAGSLLAINRIPMVLTEFVKGFRNSVSDRRQDYDDERGVSGRYDDEE